MGRDRTPIGTFGQFTYRRTASGRIEARARFRDDDGHLRLIQATGPTRKGAELALKEKLAHRGTFAGETGELKPDTPFSVLVDTWLEDLDLDGRVAESTRSLYEWNMRNLVLPAFEGYTLREITVARVDRFLKAQAKISHSRAKQAKTVLSLAFGLAVRYGALSRNPVRDVARLRKPKSTVRALTVQEIAAVRAAARAWRRGGGLSGPKPDGQIEGIIDVMLGTSARIGEALAIRKCDVNAATTPVTVTISGTIVSPKGRPTYRQDHPKTNRSYRTVAVPSFTATVLRQRLAELADEGPEHLLFYSRNHTPLTTANVRRRLRQVLAEAHITGVTPHTFRKTVATLLERAGGADLAAEMLGHTSSEITREHYIEPETKVSPVTAEILERLADPEATDHAPGGPAPHRAKVRERRAR